ncbi:MAG: CBS domain-containing protein [Hyphomicrobiales bacterium]|nr:CBS domain-containing protein [Hyphomicrobiales bacterium]
MNVAHILSQKGRDVVTVLPDFSLEEVCKLMSDKGIGAVVVCSRDADVVGILSERDIMRTLAAKGARALDDRVSSHMTSTVVTCREDTTIQNVMERMTERRFRHMPVVDDGRLVGIISIGDLIKNRLAEVESEQDDLRRYIATA